MSIWLQKSASIQKRTSPLKFDNFAEKSEKDTVSYLSTKAATVRSIARRPIELLEQEELLRALGKAMQKRVEDPAVWEKAINETLPAPGWTGGEGGGASQMRRWHRCRRLTQR